MFVFLLSHHGIHSGDSAYHRIKSTPARKQENATRGPLRIDGSNYRILTPSFCTNTARFQLPVFDASEKNPEFRIQPPKVESKPRRRKRVVSRVSKPAKMAASETGSSAVRARLKGI
jgi:hypothetical protein